MKTMTTLCLAMLFCCAVASGQTDDLETLTLERIYERTGIKAIVPEGFNKVEESDCFWMTEDKQPLDAFGCYMMNPENDCLIMYREVLPTLLTEGKSDNILSPLRFATKEIATLDKIQGKVKSYDIPFLVTDRLNCLSGAWVKKNCNADRIYYYDCDLSKTIFVKISDRSKTLFSEFRHARRVYFCREGGSFLSLLVLTKSDSEDIFMQSLMKLTRSIWFDSEKIGTAWHITN
jgi:hypothetical protein